MDRIKVLIVEDDEDWLRGLTAYLSGEPDIDIAAAESTSDGALSALADHDIDVVLMDIMLASSVEGIRLTSHITSSSAARVIMLTSLDDKEMIFEAFRAGAVDYHIKSDFKSIPDAIRSAHSRRSPINPAVAEKMREEFRRLKQLERDVKIKELRSLVTPTELEVLKLIDQGFTQPQIADKFFISLRTVKIHVGHILRKLGVGSSREAADKARSTGLLSDDNTSS